MKNLEKGRFKLLFLAVLFVFLIFYGCTDDGGGTGLTGIDAEAAGFASSGGITLPASIENADTIPADDIDMRTSTGDTTTNEEWFTDQDDVAASITLPSSVAKMVTKAFVDEPAYTVGVWLVNEGGYTNIDFNWQYVGLLFSGNLPVDYTTSYFCFVVSYSNAVVYRSHFRKITKAYGVTNLNGFAEGYFTLNWDNPTNSRFGGANQVWFGTNSMANILVEPTYTNMSITIDTSVYGINVESQATIFRVVSLDTNGVPYAASVYTYMLSQP